MASRPTAVFRCDASSTIGGGHVLRCLALASALADEGWDCRFCFRPDSLDTVPSGGIDKTHLNDGKNLVLECDAADEPKTLAGAWPGPVDLLVVDHYLRGRDFETACRPWARRIMVIDDLGDRPHDCDVLLDQTLDCPEDRYRDWVPENCRLLLGPLYALVRPEFADRREAALARRRLNGPIGRILVALGAGNVRDTSSIVVDGIWQAIAGEGVEIDVVLGGAASEQSAPAFPVDSMGTLHVHDWVEDMAELMTRADIAIGTAGSSSWERCSLGLPCLIIVAADNQNHIAEALSRAGAAEIIGRAESLKAMDVATCLKGLVESDGLRAEMAASAAKICDGKGAARVAAALTGQ